jgi:hypothetical protein
MAGKLDGWGGKLRLRNPKKKLIAVYGCGFSSPMEIL